MISFPSLELDGLRLRTNLEWDEGHFKQSIVVQRGEDRYTAFEAVEGGFYWPLFQDAHLQPVADDREVLFLTGAYSGKCQWSMSVEQAGAGALLFDLACRLQAGWSQSSQATFGAARYLSAGPAVFYSLKARVGVTSEQANTLVSQDSVVIAAWSSEKKDGSQPATFSYRYRLQVHPLV